MKLSNNTNTESFPLVEVALNSGDTLKLQRGSMVYHSPEVELKAKLNSSSRGVMGAIKAVARSMATSESMFITEAVSHRDGSVIALAPSVPGSVAFLSCSGYNQYYLNDGSFLAMDGKMNYTVTTQNLSNAFFGNNSGLFVMKTEGEGTLVIEAFGGIKKLTLENESVTIDNNHVIAWSTSLDYNIHTSNGFFNSIGTGEGLVTTLKGTGDVYVQTVNLESFGEAISKYIKVNNSNSNSKNTL